MLPALAFIGTTIASIGGFAAASISRKAVIAFSVVTAFVAVVVAFLACMKIIITGIAALMVIPTWLVSWIGMFIPSNYAGVISLIMSAKTCKAAYNLAKEKIALIGQSN